MVDTISNTKFLIARRNRFILKPVGYDVADSFSGSLKEITIPTLKKLDSGGYGFNEPFIITQYHFLVPVPTWIGELTSNRVGIVNFELSFLGNKLESDENNEVWTLGNCIYDIVWDNLDCASNGEVHMITVTIYPKSIVTPFGSFGV
jgi:hypothetical protein